jgi:chemotaxis protein MotB
VLVKISEAMKGAVKAVVVEGHTDNQPISTLAYPTNWELSGARAMSVVRFLLEQSTALSPANYVGIGHGEFQPVATNATRAGRAKNRRVEILFSWEPWQNSNSQQSLRAPPVEKTPPKEAARPS